MTNLSMTNLSKMKTVMFGAVALSFVATNPAFAEDIGACLITKTDTNPFFVKMKEGALQGAKENHIAVFDSLNLAEPSDAATLLVTGSSSVRLWDSIHADLAPYRLFLRWILI